jgi:lipoprotein-releasing system permease protein
MNALTLFLTRRTLRVKTNRILRFDYTVMILGIVISVAVVASAVSLFEGYQRTLKRILLDSNAHIIIYPDFAQSLSEKEIAAAITILKSQSEVKDVQPVFSNTAMLQSEGKVRSTLVRAYAHSKGDKWFSGYVTHGSKEIEPGSIIAGEILLNDLSVKLGDTVTLQYPQPGNLSPLGIVTNQHDFKINGIIKTGYYEMDKALIIMQDRDAYSFYNTSPQATYLEVTLNDSQVSKAQSLAKYYGAKLGQSYYPVSWIDYNGNLFSLIEVEKWLIFLVFSFLILIAALNCVSIVSTTILDRKKEIAILRTIGITVKQIKQIVFSRILSICVLSVIAGLLAGSLTAWLITRQSIYQLKGEVYFIDKINMQISVLNYSALFVLAIALIVFCILVPLKHINKLEIVEILRGR